MATSRTTFVEAKRFGNIGNGTLNQVRNDFQLKWKWLPDKANGAFITLPGGGKFRRATNMMQIERWLERGEPQLTSGYSGGLVSTIMSSPGGYKSDICLTSNSGSLRSSIGSVSAMNASPTIPSAMRSEAATKALLKIADGKAAIGETLATMRQTVDLLRNPASNLLGTIRRFRQDPQMKSLYRITERELSRNGIHTRAAEVYLRYVYGVRPIMQDIHGIISLMKESGSKSLLLSGSGHSNQQCECPTNSIYDSSFTSKTEMGPVTENAHVHCKIWARIDPNSSGLRAINQIGLLNPISLAWDLVPFSFVVDWFLPVGSCLSALTAPAGLIFVDGSTSIRTKLVGPYKHWDSRLDDNLISNSPATGTVRYEGWKRETLSSWPLPGVWADPDPFRGDRSLKALALAITNLRHIKW